MTEDPGPSAEDNAAAIAAANAAGQLVDWSRVGTACPKCGTRDVVDVRQVLRLQKPGTFSLAGVQVKAPAALAWEYRCSACGATGSAEPRHDPK